MEIKVTDRIYYLGVNDRRKQLFENMWPLPSGVAYNSYLIKDEKTALMDTVEMGTSQSYVAKVEEVLAGRELDYLVINHMEPDHSGEIMEIVRRYPNVKIVGNGKTFKILEAYFGLSDNLMEVCD
ncbi:MAG: MBL fold metallo-hydrolase, partial [Mucinivorans sp.]